MTQRVASSRLVLTQYHAMVEVLHLSMSNMSLFLESAVRHSCESTLSPPSPPVILPPLVPTSVTVIENDTLVVTCDISNSNLIFVSSASWRHANGSEVDNDLILDREAVDRSFSGQYFCVVRSIEGNEATSNITTITIQCE